MREDPYCTCPCIEKQSHHTCSSTSYDGQSVSSTSIDYLVVLRWSCLHLTDHLNLGRYDALHWVYPGSGLHARLAARRTHHATSNCSRCVRYLAVAVPRYLVGIGDQATATSRKPIIEVPQRTYIVGVMH